MSSVLRFFDYFLPESMRASPHDLVRGYILVGIIFTNIFISFLTALGLLFLLELGGNLGIALTLDAICFVGYVITLYLFKRTENYPLCANFILVLLCSVIFYGVCITGGYFQSPILQLIPQVTIMAFLMLGLRVGIIWMGITVILCAASYVGALYGVGYVQLLQSQQVINAMSFMLQFVWLGIIGGALAVYEVLNSMLERQLQAEKVKLQHWASHDDLTGVANRFEFYRRLKAHIDEAQERSQTVGVVYIDMDDFKPVNDNHGHHIGDEALRAIAERLQRALRLSDTTARLGGDEFGLILPGIRVPHDLDNIMPKVLAALGSTIQVDKKDINMTGSCGVAIYPDHAQDYSELCKFADAAMYHAKERGVGYALYHPELTARDADS